MFIRNGQVLGSVQADPKPVAKSRSKAAEVVAPEPEAPPVPEVVEPTTPAAPEPDPEPTPEPEPEPERAPAKKAPAKVAGFKSALDTPKKG